VAHFETLFKESKRNLKWLGEQTRSFATLMDHLAASTLNEAELPEPFGVQRYRC